MKRAILTLLSVLVFCNIVSGYAGYEKEVSWVDGSSPPQNNIPDTPYTSDLVYVTVNLDWVFYRNQYEAEQTLGGRPTLNINPVDREIMLEFQGSPSVPSSTAYNPVCGLRCYFGPLEEGEWVFVFRFQGYILWEYFNVIPIPFKANSPYPYDGAINVPQSLVLHWRSGYVAERHDIYFGLSRFAVDNATRASSIYRDRQPLDMTTFNPGPLNGNTNYYWRIDEVQNGTIQKGDVWGFTTADFIVHDDFESFDEDNIISDVWTEVGGATVGYSQPPYVDREIVFYGKQSMPLTYSNIEGRPYSATKRTFVPPQDWTGEGNDFLLMYVHGRPGNDRDQLYVEIGDSAGRYAQVFNTNQNIVRLDEWIPWRIPLGEFTGIGKPGIEIPGSINLRQVTSITIGIGDPPDPDEELDGFNNDNWFDAHPIGNVSNLEFDTTHATNDGYDNNIDGPNIWFCYTAPCNGPVTASLCGSSYDTKMDIYDDCYSFPSWETSIPNGYNDDFCGKQSQVTFGAIKDHKYLIEVGGYADHAGRGRLSIWCGQAAPVGPDLLSSAGPIEPIHSHSPAAVHVGKEVSDISYEADLPSQNLSDGPKLLASHTEEGTINIDSVATVGTDFGVLRGTVHSHDGVQIFDPEFFLFPRDFPEWIAPDGSYVIFLLQPTNFTVTVTANGSEIKETFLCEWDTERDFTMPMP